MSRTIVIGAGPGGLTTAYELTKHNMQPLVLEASAHVGGIARTEEYKGFRFDIGGHRFFTKVPEVEALWHEVLGDDFIRVRRLSRIYFRGKFFNYPIQLFNAFKNLGVYESVRVMLSYAKWQVRPHEKEDTFDQWVINRFGGRLYWFFFRSYTEKVWGIPPSRIRSDWAAQRIKNLSLMKALVNALTGANDTTSLINEFYYPRLGPGMMWERFRKEVEVRGGEVRMGCAVTGLKLEQNRVAGVVVKDQDKTYELTADHVVSSMPLSSLVFQLQPPAPDHVVEAAKQLKHRDFLIVTLILNKPDPFPDNWIYIHTPNVKVGRIQNFRSWSRDMVPHPDKASLGMEYFCHEGDGLWTMKDQDLIQLATEELTEIGLAKAGDVVDGTVIRQPKAYPVYDEHYQQNVTIIRDFLAGIENLQTIGRNGMHRYNNQDHSMLTAMLAVRNILGEHHDLWNVNVERSYHEEFVANKSENVSQFRPKPAARDATDIAGYQGPERRSGGDRRASLDDQYVEILWDPSKDKRRVRKDRRQQNSGRSQYQDKVSSRQSQS
ncbi:MAG: NAD(P)/FAD-dependent oxidoreductase [Gammaproteobacteria bacterium]|nr:NAD(P)/FAD-dependent oxidoreductase [Gammaproteobacteria bacterium]